MSKKPAKEDITTVYEKFLGIKTDDEEIFFGDASKLESSFYEASEYEGLMEIFNYISMLPTDTLVDYGCGMGRVLFYCNQRFMCNVCGIEYDDEIYERLTDNAEYYHVRFKNQREKFNLLHMRAEDYGVKPTDNYFYLFNPFSQGTMRKVLDNIKASLEDYPREAYIILYYCTPDILKTLKEYACFKVKHIVKLPSYRLDPYEKAYILTT